MGSIYWNEAFGYRGWRSDSSGPDRIQDFAVYYSVPEDAEGVAGAGGVVAGRWGDMFTTGQVQKGHGKVA